jgi:hypothetical protein
VLSLFDWRRDSGDLSYIKLPGAQRLQNGIMERLIIFRCPATGFDVQTLWAPRDREEKQGPHYESVTCPSCAQSHFVNRKTGKLLGYERE